MPETQMYMDFAIEEKPEPARKIYAEDGVDFWQPTPEGYKYSIRITPISKEGQKNWGEEYKYSVSACKEYGDHSGYGTCCRSKEEIIAVWERMKRSWAGFDGILGRNSDQVTLANTFFLCFTDDINKSELFGMLDMFAD